jgi:hypothetical protein
MRFSAAVACVVTGLAGIASATAIISADPPHEGPIAERSPVFTKQISAAINNALASGLDASESEKVRQAFHVGIDQVDDESDEARKALNGALGKVLPSDKVKHVDAAVDHVVDKVDSLVERDLGDSAESAVYKVLASGSVNPVGAAVGHAVDKVESPVEKRDLDASAGFAPVNGGVAAHCNGVDCTKTIEKRDDDNVKNLLPPLHIGTITNFTVPTKCDCKRVIASVIEPRPEDGMSQAWFVEWKKAFYPQGDLSTRCIKSCVDKSIHKFVKQIKVLQAAEQLSNKTVADVHAGGLDKREASNVTAADANVREKVFGPALANKKPSSGAPSTKKIVEQVRGLFAKLKPTLEASKFMKKTLEKMGLKNPSASRTSTSVESAKKVTEHMRKLFPQANGTARVDYRKWRAAFLKLNKTLLTGKKEPVSSSAGAE